MHSPAHVIFCQSQIGIEADLTCVGSCTVDPSMFLVSFYGPCSTAAPQAELKSATGHRGVDLLQGRSTMV